MSLNQPDLDLLADYVGGALDGTPEEERVGERIRTDAAWARAYADLVVAFDGVSTDLSALGASPEPMPDDVWQRLEAALSSPEAAAAYATPPKYPPTPEFTAPRDNRPSARARVRKRHRWVAPVLAAVAVLFAVSLGFALRSGVATKDSTMSTGSPAEAPQAAAARPVQLRSSGRDYTDQTLVLATDFGSVPLASAPEDPATDRANGETSKIPNTAQSFSAAVPPVLGRLLNQDALARCLQDVSGIMPGTVLGVDYAAYNHSPAAVVVVRTADDGRWVGVVGAGCGVNGADLLAQKRLG